MANIVKVKDGYKIEREDVPAIFLSDQDAFHLMEAVKRQYHLQDVQNKLEYSGIDDSRVTEKEINEICDEYEDRLGDDDTWSYILDAIISDFHFEYKKVYASEDEIKTTG